MDAPMVAAIAAGVSSAFSAGVFGLSWYQMTRQTRLMRQTSDLEAEVHRLSVELDQSLQRLHRVNELTRHMHRLFARIYGPSSYAHSGDEEADLVGCSLELAALIEVIRDDELKDYVSVFKATQKSLSEVLSLEWQSGKPIVSVTDKTVHLDALTTFSNTTERVHRRVYELLEDASHHGPKPRQG